MTSIRSLFARVLLATALCATGTAAVAGPVYTYHVDLDTSKYAGLGFGGLQLTFLSAGMPDPLSATVRGLRGDFVGSPELYNVNVENGVMRFSSAEFNEFYQVVKLGGVFSFDVDFDGSFGGDGGTGLNVGLYDVDDVSFDLIADPAPSAVFINFSTGEPAWVETIEGGSAVQVPEPSTLLSLFTGIGLLGFTLRRRKR